MYRFTSNPPSRQITPAPVLLPSEKTAAATAGGRKRGADHAPSNRSRAIKRKVERYLAATEIKPSQFGRMVAGDPSLVAGWRKGRAVGNTVAAKVEAFFATLVKHGEAFDA